MADSSVFAQFLREPKSAQEYASEYAAADDARQQNAFNRLVMGEKVQGMQEQNRLRQLYAQNPGATPEQLRRAGFRGEADKAEAAVLSRRESESKIGLQTAQGAKAQAEAAARQAEDKYNAATRHAQSAVNVRSPQDIVGYIDAGIAGGVFPAAARQQMLDKASSYGTDVERWKRDAVQGAVPVLDQYKRQAEDARQAASLEVQVRGQDTSAATQRRGQDISAATTREGQQVTMRGQSLTDARSGESNRIRTAEVNAGGKPPAGYRWAEGGRLEAIPGGPGDRLPEKQQNQVVGTQNLSNAIKEYQAELKSFGPFGVVNPSARAAMGTKYNNMMLQAKEAYNLGVLNGPDLEILTSVVTDPVSFKGAITPKGALDKQASELDRIMRGISGVSSNRRPQDAKPDKAAGSGTDLGGGFRVK